MHQRTILSVDYHDQNCVIRQYDGCTGTESLHTVATDCRLLERAVEDARRATPASGRLIWIQESTTGWARVQTLLGHQVDDFLLANVLQLPKRPKEGRKKTDRGDTQRILHEYLLNRLGLADQPSSTLREARRLVAYRENLVNRRTALRNWLNRYLAHETWIERRGLWSAKGLQRWKKIVPLFGATDQLVIQGKLDEMTRLSQALDQALQAIHLLYQKCPQAQRLDAIKGISIVSAVSIVARIGSIQRFATADQLIAYAGLAPGIRQSDQTRHSGRIGGGGTDAQLRHYLIEASVWARHLPRYRKTYERVAKRRGPRIGRLNVCRMIVRSIHKMLSDQIDFNPSADKPSVA